MVVFVRLSYHWKNLKFEKRGRYRIAWCIEERSIEKNQSVGHLLQIALFIGKHFDFPHAKNENIEGCFHFES